MIYRIIACLSAGLLIALSGVVTSSAQAEEYINSNGQLNWQGCGKVIGWATNIPTAEKPDPSPATFQVVDSTTGTILGEQILPRSDGTSRWDFNFSLPEDTGDHRPQLTVNGYAIDGTLVETNCINPRASILALCQYKDGKKTGKIAVSYTLDNRRSYEEVAFQGKVKGTSSSIKRSWTVSAETRTWRSIVFRSSALGGSRMVATVRADGKLFDKVYVSRSHCS